MPTSEHTYITNMQMFRRNNVYNVHQVIEAFGNHLKTESTDEADGN